MVGAGIAGLGAAYALARHYPVTVFEAADRLGGHAHTVEADFDGHRVPVDTGFIVYNEHNYPNLTALFERLGVATERSDMSFAVSLGNGRLEYAGTGWRGLFGQRRNIADPRFLALLLGIRRFYRRAIELLDDGSVETLTLGALLEREGVPARVRAAHVLPMAAAIWSAPVARMLEFPAISFLRFFDNHRLFILGERPNWRTVTGGSREYVRRIAGHIGKVHVASPIARILRHADGIEVTPAAGRPERFDHVVIAAHADQALTMLGDATPEERDVLGALRYQGNRAILHRDPALMPRRRRVWASWNYLGDGSGDSQRLSVSYWMNRLQNIDDRYPLFVTLNPLREPDPRLVFRELTYDHPLYDCGALAAQRRLGAIQGARRTWFCGAYCGYGFHEDGLVAGLEVAAALGAPAPWTGAPVAPAGVATVVESVA